MATLSLPTLAGLASTVIFATSTLPRPRDRGPALPQRKTVARHLSNIFTKIDVTSRTAAAAFAYEHHIT